MPNKELNNNNLVTQGSSYLYDTNATPQTRVVTNQKIRILTAGFGNDRRKQLGVISTFSTSQSRSVEGVRGLGFGDQIAELVPGVTEPETGDMERAMLYLSNLFQSVGYASGVDGPVRSLRHHRWPFDIEEQIVFSTIADFDHVGKTDVEGYSQSEAWYGGVQKASFKGSSTPSGSREGAPHVAIITMYETCWLNSYSKSFDASAAQVMESGSVTIRDTHDFSSVYGEFMPTGNDPFETGQKGSIIFDDTLVVGGS